MNSIVQVSTVISKMFHFIYSLNFGFSRHFFVRFLSHFSVELWREQINFKKKNYSTTTKNCGDETSQNGIEELKRKRKNVIESRLLKGALCFNDIIAC